MHTSHDRLPAIHRPPGRWIPTVLGTALALGVALSTVATSATRDAEAFPVSGSGIHAFSTAIVHSQTPTESGMIQRSSDIVTLRGDLEGHLLYHPTSTFDDEERTLVNTGTQYFSGTVLGSQPVILHDDRFRFDVDLESGATTGTVHLGRSSDAPPDAMWFECDLAIVGTGLTEEGDATFAYEGSCRRYGA